MAVAERISFDQIRRILYQIYILYIVRIFFKYLKIIAACITNTKTFNYHFYSFENVQSNKNLNIYKYF